MRIVGGGYGDESRDGDAAKTGHVCLPGSGAYHRRSETCSSASSYAGVKNSRFKLERISTF